MKSAQQLMEWVKQGALAPDALPQALELTQPFPSNAQQAFFYRQLLLVGGAFLCVSGLIFFFAFNWDELHRFSKFILVQVAFLLALLPLLRVTVQQPIGQVALGAAALLLGANLALVGQIYQTGADSFQLFFVWALLLLPWLLLTQQMFIAALVVLLANITLGLYVDQTMPASLVYDNLYFWLATGLNALIVLSLEGYTFCRSRHQLPKKTGLQYLITAVFGYLIFASSVLAFEVTWLSTLIFLALIALSWFWYRWHRLQIVHLSFLLLAAIFYILLRLTIFFEALLNETLIFFLGIVFMLLCTAASRYVMRLHREKNND